MSEKRRDNKNRILRTGESQRKNGRYEYKYTDISGNRRSVYSWRLVPTDKNPPDKRSELSLRELEKQIEKDIDNGIKSDFSNLKVRDLAKMYLDDLDVKLNTEIEYRMNIYSRIIPFMGDRDVKSINSIFIKQFYKHLIYEKHYKGNSVKTVAIPLTGMFRFACKKLKIIKENPVTGVYGELKGGIINGEKRKALTKSQQKELLRFIGSKNVYKHYMPMFIALIDTGCRISELGGLRWDDVDFDNNVIHIRRGLHYNKIPNTNEYAHFCDTPKNHKERTIPLSKRLRNVLLDMKFQNEKMGVESPSVGDLDGFIFLTKNGTLLTPTHANHVFNRINESYNRAVKDRSSDFYNNEEIYVTPHILRHTFCTRLCEVESNLKIIQDIMGHNDIRTTMDIYSEAQKDEKDKLFKKYDALIENAII